MCDAFTTDIAEVICFIAVFREPMSLQSLMRTLNSLMCVSNFFLAASTSCCLVPGVKSSVKYSIV